MSQKNGLRKDSIRSMDLTGVDGVSGQSADQNRRFDRGGALADAAVPAGFGTAPEAGKSALLGVFQLMTIILCGLAILTDGMDFQIIGYVAPAILRDWHISPGSLGPVFASGMIGMVIGATALGSLADRVGRRPVLIFALFMFAGCMWLTTEMHTVAGLLCLRFATGLGLGSVMPNAVALASEFAPLRKRSAIVTVVSSAFAIGAVTGGLLAVALLPSHGWHAVFRVGAYVPAVLALAMLAFLPESLQFLTVRGHEQKMMRIARRLGQYADGLQAAAPAVDIATERLTVMQLFENGRTRNTCLLWGITFLNLLTLLFLSSWLPTILSVKGQSMRSALLAGVVLQLGGCVGALIMASRIERVGFQAVLAPAFLLAAVALVAIGLPGLSLGLVFVAAALSGATIVGGQNALNALAALLYPTHLRATGIGWALGVARTGSVLGPVIGGELIAMHTAPSTLFLLVALPAALSAVLVLMLKPVGR